MSGSPTRERREFWSEAREIFAAALKVAPGQWRSFVEHRCRWAPHLGREVLSLLAAHRATSGLLEGEETHSEDPYLGRRFGAYRLVERLARGGMGVVYLAVRDDDAFDRRVAVKILPKEFASPDRQCRFQTERRILAALDHPYIGRLIDGGTTEKGCLYLVMEYVEGVPIDLFCKRGRIDLRPKLRLFLAVCDAVHYAHHKLVVHRDLKPANILVSEDGTPKLLDFGIAKLLRPEGEAGDEPVTWPPAMTPEYASPEQILGDSVTAASDVYSLGAILYALLCGRHPYAIPGESPLTVLHAALEREVEAPSRFAIGRAKWAALAGDLDAICLRALAKAPPNRYASVADLSADIRRHLDRRPVHARRPNLFYRAGRFVQRHPWEVAMVSLLLASSIGLTLASLCRQEAAERAQ